MRLIALALGLLFGVVAQAQTPSRPSLSCELTEVGAGHVQPGHNMQLGIGSPPRKLRVDLRELDRAAGSAKATISGAITGEADAVFSASGQVLAFVMGTAAEALFVTVRRGAPGAATLDAVATLHEWPGESVGAVLFGGFCRPA